MGSLKMRSSAKKKKTALIPQRTKMPLASYVPLFLSLFSPPPNQETRQNSTAGRKPIPDIYNPQVQRYLAAIFNLAIIPSRRAGRLDPKHLYLCIPWWPVPRGELDLQRWHEEKAAAPEPSDLCTYFGWDAKPSPEVLTADDARAVGPSKEDVARLNHAICVLDLGVKGRKGKGESAARRRAVEGEVSVSYVDDSTTERKLWQPRRLLFSPVVASRDRAR